MIALYTDFTMHGPYVGQMHAVLAQNAPTATVIDLMHDAPRGDPRASSYLLAACVAPLPSKVVVVAVVDPGVGDPRRRAVILEADARVYVGPDNGLLAAVARQASTSQWWEISWQPEHLSNSFHGRDHFAPVAAKLATGTPIEELAGKMDAGLHCDWPPQLAEVVYVDGFGNLISGITVAELAAASQVRIAGQQVPHARTFSAVTPGELFWYQNSMGLLEVAQNRGSAAESLGCGIGTPISIVT